MTTLVYVLLLCLGLVGSALHSGIETAVYSMSRLRLMVRRHHGHDSARRLREEIERPQRLLSTLLIGNNVANFMFTFGLTALLVNVLGFSDGQSMVFQAILVTPILLVLGETLPKELARSHADQVIYRAARMLRIERLILTCCGILPLVNAVGSLVARTHGGVEGGKAISARARMAALIEEGVGHGVITEHQTDIVDRALSMRHRTVADELLAWSRVIKLRSTETVGGVKTRIRRGRAHPSRLPVIDAQGTVVGCVFLIDLLLANEEAKITTLMRDVFVLQPETPVREALVTMQKNGEPLAIVGAPEKPMGIITLKDLFEPLVGELPAL